jgi:hypothetical protein
MAPEASGSAMKFTLEQNPAGPNFVNVFVCLRRLKQNARKQKKEFGSVVV